MHPVKFIARTLLSGIFITSGYDAMKNPAGRARVLEAQGLPEPELLVKVNGAAMLAGGVALAAGIFPRLAATGLIASLVPTTLVGHPFWKARDEGQQKADKLQALKNATTIGGLMYVALDTSSKRCCGCKRCGKRQSSSKS